MAVQHDAATTDPRPRLADPLRLRGQTTPSSLRRKKGKGRRALTKSLLANLVISASGGRRRGKGPSLILC